MEIYGKMIYNIHIEKRALRREIIKENKEMKFNTMKATVSGTTCEGEAFIVTCGRKKLHFFFGIYSKA